MPKKTNDSDFHLLNSRTKQRIKGLIEKRITPQTIALFASEYEIYDMAIKIQIIEYISFLMKEELTYFVSSIKHYNEKNDFYNSQKMQSEFEQKHENIKVIQKLLKVNAPQTSFSEKKSTILQNKNKNNNIKATNELWNNNNNRFIKNQSSNTKQINENKKPILKLGIENQDTEKVKNNTKSLEEKKKEIFSKKINVVSEFSKKPNLESLNPISEYEKNLEKNKKYKLNNEVSIDDSKKPSLKNLEKNNYISNSQIKEIEMKTITDIKINSEALLTEETKTFVNSNDKDPTIEEILDTKEIYIKDNNLSEKEYKKIQLEKEKLWKELYGTTRDKPKKIEKEKKAVNEKKTEDEKIEASELFPPEIKTISFGNVIINVDEILDPKFKMSLFWSKIKRKYKVFDLYSWLKKIPIKLQTKILKLRKKEEIKVNKLSGKKQAKK